MLDTHAFLWWIADDSRLSKKAREIIADGHNELFLSAASGWEMAIKARLGKLQLSDSLERFVPEQLIINGIEGLPVQMRHTLHVQILPDYHRDPFDRLLVAQAQLEGLPILTRDPYIARYQVKTIW